MGFSLEMFFEDLERILDNQEIDDEERVQRLNHAIVSGKQYAKDCNQI